MTDGRLHIAYILLDFDMGGMVTWVYNLATRFHRDHELHFLSTHVDRIAEKFYAVGTPAYVGQDWLALVRYLKRHHIDVVQFGQRREYANCALAASVPVVIERTDGPNRPSVMPKADLGAVIASTKGTLPDIVKTLDSRKVSLIYNGVDTQRFSTVKVDRLGLADSDILIGHVSRLSSGKNLNLLIEAVGVLKGKHSNIRLVIVGSNSRMPGAGDHESALRTSAAGLDSHVLFLGQVDSPEAIIAGFDIGVCVSRSEGIPNALLECMAAGKPVVATSVGEIDELVTHGRDGLMIEDNNLDQLVAALERLIEDESLRKRMGNAAQQRIREDFDLDKQAAKYMTLYQTLLGQKKATGVGPRMARAAYSRRLLLSLVARDYQRRVYEVVGKRLRRMPAAHRLARAAYRQWLALG